MIHQYAMKQSLFGQEMYNMLYYDHLPEDADIKQEVADALRLAWSSNISASLANDWSLLSAVVRNVEVAGTLSQEFAFTAGALVGGSAAEVYATQVAMLVVTKGQSAPPNRTRTYLAGWTEGNIANSIWGATAVGLAEDWAADVASLATTTYGTMLRQAVRFFGTPPVVVDSNPVSVVVVPNVPATQRRRRIGVGS